MTNNVGNLFTDIKTNPNIQIGKILQYLEKVKIFPYTQTFCVFKHIVNLCLDAT